MGVQYIYLLELPGMELQNRYKHAGKCRRYRQTSSAYGLAGTYSNLPSSCLAEHAHYHQQQQQSRCSNVPKKHVMPEAADHYTCLLCAAGLIQEQLQLPSLLGGALLSAADDRALGGCCS